MHVRSAGNSEEVAAIVHTFGFGSYHVAFWKQSCSEKGQGMYYFIDSNEKIFQKPLLIVLEDCSIQLVRV